ncbi:hypothetical protein SJAV_06020 [Sulfurisphaera javensis]|uniref:DNA-directed RNA polymerase subunit M n=1 Tax=Sulfurisphaera javensis TaxID=2049879 RepID=A0AAT9GP30_9CREN
MKKGERIAVVAKGNNIYAICIFRGDFLEKIFFESDIKLLEEKFLKSSVSGEVKNISHDKEKEEYCKLILEKIERKLNKLLVK